MAVGRLDLKVPTTYEPSPIREIILSICNNLDSLAVGRSAAKPSSRTNTPAGSVDAYGVSDIVYDSDATAGSSIVPGLPIEYVRLGWVWTAAGAPGVFKEIRVPTGNLSSSVPNNVALASDGAGGFGFRTLTSADVPSALSGMNTALATVVALNNTANYFDGPSQSVVAGVGTYFVSGTVTVIDTGGSANIFAKLWDGTTVFASASIQVPSNQQFPISLSAVVASPAGNIRISCRDSTRTTGSIMNNNSANNKDSHLAVLRIG